MRCSELRKRLREPKSVVSAGRLAGPRSYYTTSKKVPSYIDRSMINLQFFRNTSDNVHVGQELLQSVVLRGRPHTDLTHWSSCCSSCGDGGSGIGWRRRLQSTSWQRWRLISTDRCAVYTTWGESPHPGVDWSDSTRLNVSPAQLYTRYFR